MAKPKLALIPAAQGSKFYSVLPSSGVGDFDFTRSGSATRINSQGLIETVGNGVSRLNYPMIDGKVVGCPHHILEPQRTNLVTYSEDFSQSYWNKSGGIIISSNSTTSIDGTLNATKINGANSYGSVFIPSTTVLNGVKYTYSVFVKKNISSKLALRAMTTGNDTRVVFNLDDLSTNISEGYDIGYDSSSIEVYSNGWYRCILTITTATTSLRLNIYPDSPPNVSSQSGVYIYGAMLEQGSYPTSYIPTNGEANGVTRSAETANGSGDASTFNDSEGVLMAEISALDNDVDTKRISISDGTSSNRLSISFSSELYGAILVSNGGVIINNSFEGYQVTLSNKIAIKYKQNDFSVFINGFEIYTNNNGNTTSFNTLRFDDGYSSGLPFYGKTKQIQYYDSALTDSELEQLTSWVSFSDMVNGQLYTIE